MLATAPGTKIIYQLGMNEVSIYLQYIPTYLFLHPFIYIDYIHIYTDGIMYICNIGDPL